MKKILFKIAGILFWIIVWIVAAKIVGYEIILPSPATVVKDLSVLVREPYFFISCGTSILRILAGLAVGTLAGILFGVLSAVSEAAYSITSPLFTVIKTTPVASIILLLFFWSDKYVIPAIISMLIVIPVIWSGVSSGIQSVTVQQKEVMRFFIPGIGKKISRVYIPASLPFFINSLKTAIGLCWKAGIAAEIICTPDSSIGGYMYSSKMYLDTTRMFSWTIVVIILSFIIEKFLAYLLTLLLNRKQQYRSEQGGETS